MRKSADSIAIGQYIKLKKNVRGIWEITHPNQAGRTVRYSTGVKGNASDIKRWVKDANIQDIVEVGMRRALSTVVINRITGRNKSWLEIIEEYREYCKMLGHSPQTIRGKLSAIRRYVRYIEPKHATPNGVIEADIFNYINGDELRGLKYGSKKSALSILTQFWEWLVNMAYADRNVPSNVRVRSDLLFHSEKERKARTAFTLQEFNQLIAHFNKKIEDYKANEKSDRPPKGSIGAGGSGWKPWTHGPNSRYSNFKTVKFFRSAAHFAYGIGLRKSDCALLEWDSLSQPGWIIVHTGKTDKRVAIPYLNDTIEDFIRTSPYEDKDVLRAGLNDSAYYIKKGIEYIDDDDELSVDFIYCYPRHARIAHGGGISVDFKRELKRAGLEHLSFHSLRRSRIREWQSTGLSIAQIGKFVGHSNAATTEIYLTN